MIGRRKTKYYQSIDDCPVFYFQKAMGGDLSALLKDGKHSEGKATDAWNAIMTEYIDAFGVPLQYKKYLKKMQQATQYLDKVYNKGQKAYSVHAKIAQKEAESILPSRSESNIGFEKTVAMVSKFMGFAVNPRQTSTRDFYGYLKLMEDGK